VNSIIIKLDTAHAGEPEKESILRAIASVYNSILLFRLTFQRKLLSDYSIYKMGKKLWCFCGAGGSFYGEKRQ
jgi:hypothetical protein